MQMLCYLFPPQRKIPLSLSPDTALVNKYVRALPTIRKNIQGEEISLCKTSLYLRFIIKNDHCGSITEEEFNPSNKLLINAHFAHSMENNLHDILFT